MIIKRTFKNDKNPSIPFHGCETSFSARLHAAKYNLWRDALKMNRHIDGFLQINQIELRSSSASAIDSETFEVSSNTYEMEEKAYNVFTFTPIEDIYLKYRTFKG